MSLGEAVIAPFVAVYEYGRELSLPRLLSWWVWGTLIALIWRKYGRIFFTVCALTLCGSLVYQGAALLVVWARDVRRFRRQCGCYILPDRCLRFRVRLECNGPERGEKSCSY